MTEQIIEKRRLASPATTPQALAWDSRNKRMWLGSRDLRRIYAIDPRNGNALKEQEAPGIPWPAVVINGELRFTIGEGADDDRYIYRYASESGFSKMFACPEFTGSYLSFDGKNLYMSQWYKKRILKFDAQGNETHGRCWHPILRGSGGFAGATGVLQFKDVLTDPPYYPYRGTLKI